MARFLLMIASFVGARGAAGLGAVPADSSMIQLAAAMNGSNASQLTGWGIRRDPWGRSPTPNPTAAQDSCSAAIDLSTVSSPYVGTTVTGMNTHATSCGGNGNEQIFYIDVPSGSTLKIGMFSNTYDSLAMRHVGVVHAQVPTL
ncbi:unnamed protein product [Prorocentrum cordatum]|uniref:Uncharacterized protein n=1 Tax=Prorocentrum cordatum TaxID=2364126 RepID=A0ABN9WKN1_9DINO|nr:unnamed protein product [Polarella glacialis]